MIPLASYRGVCASTVTENTDLFSVVLGMVINGGSNGGFLSPLAFGEED